jgi:hypothetical protein
MIIQTQYSYEKIWRDTSEEELLKIIEDEIGKDDTKGVLLYIKESLSKDKMISVGSCKFKKKGNK